MLLYAAPAWAIQSAIPAVDVSEVDGQMDAFIKVISGSPSVVVIGHGPNNSDPITLGTLNSSTPRITWVGPMSTIAVPVITGAGVAEVSFCGRVAP